MSNNTSANKEHLGNCRNNDSSGRSCEDNNINSNSRVLALIKTDARSNDKNGTGSSTAVAVMNKFQVQFQGFKYKSFLRIFPLQQQAFDFIDGHGRARENVNVNISGNVNLNAKIDGDVYLHVDSNSSEKEKGIEKVEGNKVTHDDKEDHENLISPCGGGGGGTGTKRVCESGNRSLYFSLEERLFATENNCSGKRRYVAAHLGRFMYHYWREIDASCRHYYELIREETPCRLYFDLEYNKIANQNITEADNEILMDEFINELSSELSNTFDIGINRRHVVDLDSSTAKKFSRHLIVHLPGRELFEDAPTCGAFVRKFIGRIAEEVANGTMAEKRPTLAKYLFVNNEVKLEGECVIQESEKENVHKDQPKTCFVDIGVYTRNRLFRLLGSTKFGKPSSAGLRIALANQFPFPDGFTNELFYHPDLDSNPDSNLPQSTSDGIKEEEETYWDRYAEALVHTFVVPLQKDIVDAPILPQIIPYSSPDTIISNQFRANHAKCKRNNASNIGPSSFPTLDDFVNNNLATRKGLNGSIRSWKFDGNHIVTYYMKGNRWCENINRSHKSNNIMWNVSIIEGTYWQSCLDPECCFRGNVRDLPLYVKDSLNNFLITKAVDIDEDFEKALMGINLDKRSQDMNLGNESGNKIDSFEVNDEFNQALMNLNLSDFKECGEEGIKNSSIGDASSSSNDFQDKNGSGSRSGNNSDEDSSQSSSQSETKKDDVEDSFDSEFASALLVELSKNPSLKNI